MLLASDMPEGIAKSMGLGTIEFAQIFRRIRPDILLLLGDRLEMHAAAVASLPFKIPLAHIHGGESTEGAMDEALRHSLTKFSHLHFTSAQEYHDRIVQMGEEPWRVTVSGAPCLDNLNDLSLISSEKLQARHDISFEEPPLLVTYHPVTLEYEQTEWQVSELMAALENADRPVIFTYPNADTYGRRIIKAIHSYETAHPNAKAVKNLGTRDYFSLMNISAAMVGNSSSGILEAASFKLPVVNIGSRQRGRIRSPNVIDVDYTEDAILKGIRRALSSEFRAKLRDLRNPYGDGRSTERILGVLKTAQMNDRLMQKRFYRLPSPKPNQS